MSEPRLVAYIDEAGDSGGKFGAGSSQFLAIGCTVLAIADLDATLSLFEEARAEREHSRTFRKFSENNEKDNFVLTQKLGKRGVRLVTVALHKPSLDGSHIRSDPQSEYQYLVKYALERVSWLARDSARGGKPEDNRCKLVFSEQKTYPYEDLCKYLNRLQKPNTKYNCSIEWNYLHPTIESEKHKNETPIHFADLAASAFHRAIEPKQHGMTDDRYLRNLLPAVYTRGGKYYGLKLFPPRQIGEMRDKGELGFLKLLP